MQTGNGIKPVFTRPEIEKLYGSSFTDGNNVQLLWKSKELFKMIFDSVSKAKRLICLEFYIFRNDETGAELARLLKRKHAKGFTYISFMTILVPLERRGNFGKN